MRYESGAAVDLATRAREAYAAGWALSGGPLTPQVQAGCAAAIINALEHGDHPGILDANEASSVAWSRLMLLRTRSGAIRKAWGSWPALGVGARWLPTRLPRDPR